MAKEDAERMGYQVNPRYDTYLDILRRKNPEWFINGFSHPELLCFTIDSPQQPQLMRWGLIPHWVKDSTTANKIANQTLNARAETIFTKPSFRKAARHQRCIIMATGFFEHFESGKEKIPFHVRFRDGRPMMLAGIYDCWEQHTTCSIVTTRGTAQIAAAEKCSLEESRMPVVLTEENAETWLQPWDGDAQIPVLLACCIPFPDDGQLEVYTVRKLLGKEAAYVRDSALAVEPFEYPALF
jgi:putative SOS response-associated peptidase YedK